MKAGRLATTEVSGARFNSQVVQHVPGLLVTGDDGRFGQELYRVPTR